MPSFLPFRFFSQPSLITFHLFYWVCLILFGYTWLHLLHTHTHKSVFTLINEHFHHTTAVWIFLFSTEQRFPVPSLFSFIAWCLFWMRFDVQSKVRHSWNECAAALFMVNYSSLISKKQRLSGWLAVPTFRLFTLLTRLAALLLLASLLSFQSIFFLLFLSSSLVWKWAVSDYQTVFSCLFPPKTLKLLWLLSKITLFQSSAWENVISFVSLRTIKIDHTFAQVPNMKTALKVGLHYSKSIGID